MTFVERVKRPVLFGFWNILSVSVVHGIWANFVHLHAQNLYVFSAEVRNLESRFSECFSGLCEANNMPRLAIIT